MNDAQKNMAILDLQDGVDRAAARAIEAGLTNHEVAQELREIAQGWEDAI